MTDQLRGAFGDKGGGWEVCTVENVHTESYTCDVLTSSTGQRLTVPFATMSIDKAGLAGEVSVPRRGQRFLICTSVPDPVLGPCVPSLQPPPDQVPVEHRVDYATAEGSLVYNKTGSKNYRGSMPADVQIGDWIRINSQGNLVALRESGVAMLKASELAKVVANTTNDLLQLVGRNLDIQTDFGEIKFRNEGGRVSMTMKGGSQQTTQTGADAENYTLHLAMGADGEVCEFRVSDEQDHTLAKVHYRPDGSIEEVGNNNLKQLTGDYIFKVDGSRTEEAARYSFNVNGDASVTVRGTKTLDADNVNISSGSTANFLSSGHMNLNAGGPISVTTGGSLLAKPGDAAYTTVVSNGSWVVDIGSPAADLQKALSGFSLSTTLGDIVFNTKGGKFAARTAIPESIHLGGPAPLWHATMYEFLETFLRALGTALDLHNHPGPYSPPSAPIFKTVESLLQLAKSKYVRYGG